MKWEVVDRVDMRIGERKEGEAKYDSRDRNKVKRRMEWEKI